MTSYRQLGSNDKEIVKHLSGNHRGVEWDIVTFLNVGGMYYARVFARVGTGKPVAYTTKEAVDLDTAVSFGANCLQEAFDLLGVSDGT